MDRSYLVVRGRVRGFSYAVPVAGAVQPTCGEGSHSERSGHYFIASSARQALAMARRLGTYILDECD